MADRLFAKGCKEIFHGQIAAYYVALVKVDASKLPQILPGKTAQWYKLQWKSVEEHDASTKKLLPLGMLSGVNLFAKPLDDITTHHRLHS